MREDTAHIDLTAHSPLTTPPAVAEHIRRQPECQLLWAVLENGVEEYRKYATSTSRRGKRLFREAEAWIMQNDPTWLFSFVNICHILEIDPDYLRTVLRRWHESHTTPALFKEAA
jgi:hypothetical protein